MVQNGLVNGYNTMENYPLKVKLKAKDNHIVYEVSNRVNHHLTNQADNKFISKFELPFTLLSDEDKKIVEDYGVWVEKNMYGKKYMGTARTTFIIDENGIIQHIIKKVDNKNASQQIRDLMAK